MPDAMNTFEHLDPSRPRLRGDEETRSARHKGSDSTHWRCACAWMPRRVMLPGWRVAAARFWTDVASHSENRGPDSSAEPDGAEPAPPTSE